MTEIYFLSLREAGSPKIKEPPRPLSFLADGRLLITFSRGHLPVHRQIPGAPRYSTQYTYC